MGEQHVSTEESALLMSDQVMYGRPNPQLMRIHADDVQGTLPKGESPEEYCGI